jgi:dsRNA-specific ribonuclease
MPVIAAGRGSSRRLAEQDAAEVVLARLTVAQEAP